MLNTPVALIPARAGSKRVKSKNVRVLAGHPLIAYTIAAALKSGVFSAILVSTDSEEIADIAGYYGAEVPFLRPPEFAQDSSPDIEWVSHIIGRLSEEGRSFDSFSILRPTSPFRQAGTIQRAWSQFRESQDFDSLRAVELCDQHPYKMWTLEGVQLMPLFPGGVSGIPWHSRPYQSLPAVYAQNASLEIARTSTVFESRSISGDRIMAFLTEGYEGFDVNTESDFTSAEFLVEQKKVTLPEVIVPHYAHRSPHSPQ